ncbi:acyltransferase family protein [Kineosporia sp. R_H_3]|uniref:acyltransferase family protein n=1 Tax=Kineosporia sp. R_H_3 TaxID=1961848 RepID=UPI001303FD1C|nr:acyltransferase family protein [Kineosporia sp. R_H_3]
MTAPVRTTPARPFGTEPDVPEWLLVPAPRRPAPPAPRRPPVPQPRQTPEAPGTPDQHRAPAVLPTLDDYVPPPLPAAPAAPRPEPRVAFRPDVEGLRGLAVLLVVLYHAGLPGLTGGFVGVDVFFVVSGYVITSLLVAEVRDHAGVGLAGFYARRCRRILPAAGLVLVATCALGAVLLPPLARVDLARDVLASALYGGNWHFVAEQTDYLRAGGDPSPVLHYWSLGVEEQFYLVWPFVFVGALALARRLRIARTTALAGALTLLTAGSFALSLHWTQTSAPLAYLSSPSRAWQFAAGAWLALLLPVVARLRSRPALLARSAAGLVGLVTLGWAAARTVDAGYPGTHALVPTLATAALLAAGSDVPRTRGPLTSRLLSTAVMRRLGTWSFTWYLWHWPLIVLVAARWGDLTWPVRLAVAVGALGPAALTSRWVERPLRRSAVVSARPRNGLALGVAATVVPLTVALLLGSVVLDSADTDGSDRLAAGRVDRSVVHFDDSLSSGPVRPRPFEAATDLPPIGPGCHAELADSRSPGCISGATGPKGPVVLFGDSHASQWMTAVTDLARTMGTSVLLLTHSGCPAARISVAQAQALTQACDAWREDALRRIEDGPTPALVVVSGFNGYLRHPAEREASWRPTLSRLVDVGAPLVYVADSPHPDRDVPRCMSGAEDDWTRCAFPRSTALRTDLTADEIAAGAWPRTYLVDLTDLLCPPSGRRATCPAARGGVLLYRDGSHLTDTAVGVLSPQFVAAVHAQVD